MRKYCYVLHKLSQSLDLYNSTLNVYSRPKYAERQECHGLINDREMMDVYWT